MTDARELVLVRHGPPDIRVNQPAPTWQLCDDGRADVALLAEALPRAPVVVTSDEPKAVQTAEILHVVVGGDLRVDVRLREAIRPDAWVTDYEVRAARYLTRGHEPGWEPAHDVRDRVREAIGELPSGAIVVGHGLSLTLYTATLARFDHVSFWRHLRLPDAWIAAEGVAPRIIEPRPHPERGGRPQAVSVSARPVPT
jgi:broad specificity phosphatase PhoE